MDIFNIYALCIFGLAVVLIGKTIHDQSRLIGLYQKLVNPNFPLAPGEKSSILGPTKDGRPVDPLGVVLISRYVRVSFSKHPKHPDMAKLAKRVRAEFFLALAVMVLGVGAFAVLMRILH